MNTIRNKYAHSANYKAQASDIDRLKELHNAALPVRRLDVNDSVRVEGAFDLNISKKSIPINVVYNYGGASNREKLFIIFGLFCGKIIPYIKAARTVAAKSGLAEAQKNFRNLMGSVYFK